MDKYKVYCDGFVIDKFSNDSQVIDKDFFGIFEFFKRDSLLIVFVCL